MHRACLCALVFCLWLPKSVKAQVPPPANTMTKQEFNEFLQELRSEVPRWRGVIAKVDVLSLHELSYTEGKTFETMQSGCLKALDGVEAAATDLATKKNFLVIEVILLHELEQLQRATSVYTVALGFLDRSWTDRRLDTPKILLWQDALREILKNKIDPIENRFYWHVYALSLAVDTKVDVSTLSL